MDDERKRKRKTNPNSRRLSPLNLPTKKKLRALFFLLYLHFLIPLFRFPPKISENSEENETFPFSLRILKKKKKKSFGERKREREKEKRRKRERARVSE